MFIGKESTVLVYVDDCIIFFEKGPCISDSLIKSLANGKDFFEFTDERYLKIYIGMDVKKHKDRSIKVTQPHLIEQFIKSVDQKKTSTSRQSQKLFRYYIKIQTVWKESIPGIIVRQ